MRRLKFVPRRSSDLLYMYIFFRQIDHGGWSKLIQMNFTETDKKNFNVFNPPSLTCHKKFDVSPN